MEEKYTKLLDSEMLKFVERTEELYSSVSIDLDIDKHRLAYDQMAKVFHHGRPEGLSIQDKLVENIPVRIYETDGNRANGAKAIIYMHGGGFMLGGLDSHDDVCAELASISKTTLISIGYGLFPESLPYVALMNCISVINSFSNEFPEIILAGDSSGALLAANLSRNLIGNSKISVLGQVLIYPGFGGDMSHGSYVRHSEAPLLKTSELKKYREVLYSHSGSQDGRSLDVFLGGNFESLPKTVVFSAEFDPLADDGGKYCNHIRRSGGQAEWYLELGLVHGYLRARHHSKKARASFERIVEKIVEFKR